MLQSIILLLHILYDLNITDELIKYIQKDLLLTTSIIITETWVKDE